MVQAAAKVDAIISQMGERIGPGGGTSVRHPRSATQVVRGAQEIDGRHQVTEDIESASVLASRRRAAAA
jgi:hypothetical protein